MSEAFLFNGTVNEIEEWRRTPVFRDECGIAWQEGWTCQRALWRGLTLKARDALLLKGLDQLDTLDFHWLHLPCEEVDEPECERVWPHVAKVGQGVEEGHVGAADRWVRDAREERHLGYKPYRERSTRTTETTATIKTETIKDDDYILHGVDANSVESEHSDDENIEANWESGPLAKIEPARHFWKLPWFLVLTYVSRRATSRLNEKDKSHGLVSIQCFQLTSVWQRQEGQEGGRG